MELMFGEDGLTEDMLVAQELRDLRKVIEPAAGTGHGIDDHEPFHLLGGALHARYFLGLFSSVWTRNS